MAGNQYELCIVAGDTVLFFWIAAIQYIAESVGDPADAGASVLRDDRVADADGGNSSRNMDIEDMPVDTENLWRVLYDDAEVPGD